MNAQTDTLTELRTRTAHLPEVSLDVAPTGEHVIDLGEGRGTVVWALEDEGWSATLWDEDNEVVTQDGDVHCLHIVSDLLRMAGLKDA